MRFADFFQFKKSGAKPLVKNFDQAMIKKINKWNLPSWQQSKYFFRFLNNREKTVFWSSFSLFTVTLIIWLFFYIFGHIAMLPSIGGEYTEGLIGYPKLINPVFDGANDVDSDISSLLYAKLFKHNENRELVPDIVEDYQISEDRKTYTLTLKQNIFWSDGEQITADDVAFTLDTIQNPETGSTLFNSFQGVGVEKLGDYQISLTLKEPFTPFLSHLTLGILPEHIFGQINPTNLRLAKDNLQPTVVSGPYKFVKFTKDNSSSNIQAYILERNEKYFGDKPYLKTITFKFYDNYVQAIEDLRNQNINGLGFIPNYLKEKAVSKNFNLYDLQLPQYTALFFNQTKDTVLKDDVLRSCLAMSIDKKNILEEALKGNGQIINSPILKNEIGYYPDIKKTAYNIEEANNLLDKSWSRLDQTKFLEIRKEQLIKNLKEQNQITSSTPSSTIELSDLELENEAQQLLNKEIDPDQTFYRKDKNNNILSLTITTADTPEYATVAKLIARFWKNIGIQTFVELTDGKQIVKENIRERNYSILLFGAVLGGNDPDPYAFWHSSQTQFPGLNLALFNDKDADKLLEDARIIDDETKREEAYKKFQDILAKQIPAIFLYSPSYTFAIDTNIKGISIGPILAPADRFSSLNKWYIKTAKQWK
ncbi:MAG: peptide ABC transporter substrate-binding protein [Candidatus Magasanikbacteria bacterium]|nr:peptide ABC transporter substrate-binding protein [Candidatus Magasanikbacteria bacterium]